MGTVCPQRAAPAVADRELDFDPWVPALHGRGRSARTRGPPPSEIDGKGPCSGLRVNGRDRGVVWAVAATTALRMKASHLNTLLATITGRSIGITPFL